MTDREHDDREPDDEVEIELVGSASAPASAEAATTGSTDGGRRSGPLVVVGALLVALVGWIALDAVLTTDGDETAAPTTTSPADPAPTTTTAAPETTTTTSGEFVPTTTPTAPFPALRLLPAADALGVPLAVATAGFGFDPNSAVSTVWLIDDGRVLSRGDVPVSAERFGNEMVYTGGTVLFAGHNDLVTVDGATGAIGTLPTDVGPGDDEEPQQLAVANGMSPGEVWIFEAGGPDVEDVSLRQIGLPGGELLVARQPMVDTVAPAPVADGLLSYDGTTTGYWSPDGGLTPLTSLTDGPWNPGPAGGDLALVGRSEDRRLRVIDVRADAVVAELVAPDDLAAACFAPDQGLVALRHLGTEADGNTGSFADLFAPRITVVDLASPEPEPVEITFDAPVTAMTWVSPTRFVAATPEQLVAVDVTTGEQVPVAELAGAEAWLVTADGPGC
ncbi:MAG: hypothetical protein S0880_16120 [Actinomycetota bacterium]|nr:hypothetical protein [Actinomycetota bacterium]